MDAAGLTVSRQGLTYVVNRSSDPPPDAARSRTGPEPGLLQQDALREWFVHRFNALADHLVRLENFRTGTGEIRPLAMQQTSMTVNRILNITAHLLASGERAARFSDVWDLEDLYRTLAGGVDKLFASAHWKSKIIPGVAALPGSLADLFTRYARKLRDEFVAEVAEGITDREGGAVSQSGSILQADRSACRMRHSWHSTWQSGATPCTVTTSAVPINASFSPFMTAGSPSGCPNGDGCRW
jgi:hypothetical protein